MTSPTSGAFADAAGALRSLDEAAKSAARRRHDRLTKPPGSLGRLEALGVQLAGIAGRCPPPVPASPAVAVFAGDHGVVAEGVSAWPQAVTAQMVANIAGGGAAIAVLARALGAQVHVVDVGVAADLPPHPTVRPAKIARGTANLAREAAMTGPQAAAALDVGAAVARDLVAGGTDVLVTGDMGIGNTTAAACLISALTGSPAEACTGPGAGTGPGGTAGKVAVVASASARAAGLAPLEILAEVGGLEIAALAGFVVGGVAARVPVVVDGVIALAALVVADAAVPGVRHGCVAGHRSAEPGASVALGHLGLEPLLDLGLRLGEGTGACLALPLLRAAGAVLAEMATFDEAGVGHH